ncbi:MAG TPA: MBL fold metallo-hydrolase [Chloroflexia bacterium]|nr:MBL fold metallo-hydrolase [Chloroflexia bacterium]
MTNPNNPSDPSGPPDAGQPTRAFPPDDPANAPGTPPAGAPPPWATPPAGTPVPPTAPWAGPASTPSDPTVATPITPVQGVPIPPVASGPIYPAASRGPGPLPWIVGGVAALALLGLLVFLLNNNKTPAVVPPTATPTATILPATTTPQATATLQVIVVTATPGPPSPTGAAPPTNTALPPSPAPTDTPIPGLPTVTPPPVPPSATPAPPSATPLPPTDTPIPATDTAVPALTATATGSATPSPGIPGPSDATATPTPPPAVGTGGPADAAPALPQEGYLTIQWFGQSCFLLLGGEDVRILIDPVGPDFGYHLPFFDQLDALLISHLHADHTFTQVVPGGVPNYVGLAPDGNFQPLQQSVKTAAVRDVASFHDTTNGRTHGENAMWVVDMDGFHIVHLGDLGQLELSDKQLQELGHPDILMIPVGGGGLTIDGLQARQIVDQLHPSLVIPMHYRTDRTPASLPLVPVDGFIGRPPPAQLPNVVRLKKGELPKQTHVLVMSYK